MASIHEKQEKDILRDKLKDLGYSSSPNASLDTLKEKYETALSEQKEAAAETPVESTAEMRNRVRREALKLVRVRIKNVNPSKKDLPGEIYTVANSLIGKQTKYIPYDEAGESYHIPMCIYNLLNSKTFLQVRTYKDPDTKETKVASSHVPEFVLEILPQLTKDELHDLAAKQEARSGIV